MPAWCTCPNSAAWPSGPGTQAIVVNRLNDEWMASWPTPSSASAPTVPTRRAVSTTAAASVTAVRVTSTTVGGSAPPASTCASDASATVTAATTPARTRRNGPVAGAGIPTR